jgi:hypothetical protein
VDFAEAEEVADADDWLVWELSEPVCLAEAWTVLV